MRIASVIVDVSSRALDRSFDYLVPEALGGVEVGCAVSVEFGSRPAVGWVVGLRDESAEELSERGLSPEKMKALLGVLSEPFFDEVSSELVFWISREYLCPLSDALHLFTPPGGSPKMKRVEGSWQLVCPGVGPVDDRWVSLTEEGASYVPAKGAVKQRAVIEALSQGGMRAAELSLELGPVNAQLASLEEKGVVAIERRRRIRSSARPAPEPSAPPELTSGQAAALAAIEERLRAPAGSPGGRVVVLDGVTGSGKTEVYLRAIEEVLGRGQGAIVLVPEIALTPQTVGRFRARFGEAVAVLHSRLSAGERFDQWDLVRTGGARVVVGTRSALFAPLHDVGLVVIDEEHEDSYKQESSPRYSAREVALRMCELRGATLVLGSATPSVSTLSSCEDGVPSGGTWRHVVLSERPNGRRLPEVEVVDMAREFSGGSRSMFSRDLSSALLETLSRGEKAVLMLNRRGFASFLLCRECGYVPSCPNCAVSLTYHEHGSRLVCHHCGHEEAVPPRCPKCASPYLRKFGTGTERVESELRQVVGEGVPIVRMDADTVKGRGKGAHEQLLSEFASREGGAILLGTQMIAKGLDFPDVTLVGVINADTTLKLPDFRASERTYQLLEQVSGRAGRAGKPGRVIAQTYMPKHPAVVAAASHDRKLFLDEELPQREALGYPPFTRLANVLVWGEREEDVKQEAVKLALAIDSALESRGLSWTLLGPSPCLLERLRGFCRWHILLKAGRGADVSAVLGPVLLARRPHAADVRVAVDVDPVNLF